MDLMLSQAGQSNGTDVKLRLAAAHAETLVPMTTLLGLFNNSEPYNDYKRECCLGMMVCLWRIVKLWYPL